MKWLFNKLCSSSDDGRNTVYDNFKDEDKKLVETFVREFFQNYLDALPPGETGRLVIKLLDGTQIDKAYNKSILRELEGRLKASNDRDEQIETHSLNLDNPKVMTLEEFNTVGLTGEKKPIITDLEKERWSNYWHGTAKQSKSFNNLGSAGQGKITYNMISKAQTVLALTRPIDEKEDLKDLIFGKTCFRHTYQYSVRGRQEEFYGFNGFWCNGGFDTPLPEKGLEEVNSFKKAYSLKRESETGTSWVIPSVKDEINKDALIRATLKEFYVPIFLNKMDLKICDVKICQSNIRSLIEKYHDESMPSFEYFQFFEDAAQFIEDDFYSLKNKWWEDELTENDFETEFEVIKEKFENKKCIGFKVPVEVCPEGESVKNSFVKVWIQLREENKAEFSYCRRSLLISKEPRSHRIPENSPVLAFVLAEDEPVAEFLSKAEEPSHLNWNRKMDGLKEYVNSNNTLATVRKSLKSIYGTLRTAAQERDDYALIDILSIPGNEKKKVKKPKPSEKKRKEEGEEEKPKPIIIKTRPFLTVDDGRGIRVKPGPSATDEVNYPVSCVLTAAYHNIDIAGDAYKNYHPFDFDFNESFQQISVESRNIMISEKNENKIKFEIDNKDFLLELKGFRTDRQIRAKVGYKLS